MISTSIVEHQNAERIEELSGALLDDHINDDEWAELDGLLANSAASRHAYINMMQLHADFYLIGRERNLESRRQNSNVSCSPSRFALQ